MPKTSLFKTIDNLNIFDDVFCKRQKTVHNKTQCILRKSDFVLICSTGVSAEAVTVFTRLTVIFLRPAAVDGADVDGVLYLTLSRGFTGCDLIESG